MLIDEGRGDVERVAGRPRHEDGGRRARHAVGFEHPPQVGDVGLEGGGRGGGRLAVPQLLDQAVDRDHAARFEQEQRQQGPVLGRAEVDRLTSQISEGTLKPKPRVQFDSGDTVRVIDGPFSGFNGSVEEVNAEKGRLRVLVSIFGRATPVELDFMQVEKAQ